jgi:hypothetical protein
MITYLFTIAIVTVTLASNAHAQDQRMYHRYFKTGYDFDLVRGCIPGDILVAQLSPDVYPPDIVGRLCDLRAS